MINFGRLGINFLSIFSILIIIGLRFIINLLIRKIQFNQKGRIFFFDQGIMIKREEITDQFNWREINNITFKYTGDWKLTKKHLRRSLYYVKGRRSRQDFLNQIDTIIINDNLFYIKVLTESAKTDFFNAYDLAYKHTPNLSPQTRYDLEFPIHTNEEETFF